MDFFFCHHSLLLTQFSSLITYHLKYPNFPNSTRLALITQFCHYFLFQKKFKKNWKVEICGWALFQKKKKFKKNPKVKHCGWTVRELWVSLRKCHRKQSYGNWKHLKCVFSFHNSSLKNQRIEWSKQKLKSKFKRTSQPWIPPFLSYELWKQQIQIAP